MNDEWLHGAFNAGLRCNTEADMLDGIPVGIVRVTIGAVNTLEDVDALVACLSRNLMEQKDHVQATVEIYDKKHEGVLESRSPSAVSEVKSIRIEPMTSGREEHDKAPKISRRPFLWLERRRDWLSALIHTGSSGGSPS
jgi:molybdenum cofactor sulfurtransferase